VPHASIAGGVANWDVSSTRGSVETEMNRETGYGAGFSRRRKTMLVHTSQQRRN